MPVPKKLTILDFHKAGGDGATVTSFIWSN